MEHSRSQILDADAESTGGIVMSKFPNRIYLSIIPEQPGCRENDIYEEWSLAPIEGAENQEYFALTWEDIELLHTFLYAVKNNKHGCFTFTRLSDEQYEEVLRRFRETKKERA